MQTPPTEIQVTDSMILRVHPEVETFRANRMRPLIADLGTMFQPTEFNPVYPTLKPEDRCYDNAWQVASTHKELIYVEGLMLLHTVRGPFMLPHAWCTTADGKIVDPTCPKYQNIKEAEFIGIPLKKKYVREWKARKGYVGLLDGNFDGKEHGVYYDPPSKFVEKLNVPTFAEEVAKLPPELKPRPKP